MAGELEPLPEADWKDRLQSVAQAGMNAVPFVGGTLAELFEMVITPSLERRRDAWLRELAAVVDELRERVDDFSVERLAESEEFISAVMAASQAAMRTADDDKLRALRNAVLNSVLLDLDAHRQAIFLRLADELTPLHLRMLAYLRDPYAWYDRYGIEKGNTYMGPRSTILMKALPEFAGEPDLIKQIAHDLDIRGLANGSGLTGMVSENALYDSLTTSLGNQFLNFIGDSSA